MGATVGHPFPYGWLMSGQSKMPPTQGLEKKIFLALSRRQEKPRGTKHGGARPCKPCAAGGCTLPALTDPSPWKPQQVQGQLRNGIELRSGAARRVSISSCPGDGCHRTPSGTGPGRTSTSWPDCLTHLLQAMDVLIWRCEPCMCQYFQSLRAAKSTFKLCF